MRRSLLDREVDIYGCLLDGIYQAIIHFGEEEWIGCEKEQGENYTVKSYYVVLAKERVDLVFQPQNTDPNFPNKRIWDKTILFEITFVA